MYFYHLLQSEDVITVREVDSLIVRQKSIRATNTSAGVEIVSKGLNRLTLYEVKFTSKVLRDLDIDMFIRHYNFEKEFHEFRRNKAVKSIPEGNP